MLPVPSAKVGIRLFPKADPEEMTRLRQAGHLRSSTSLFHREALCQRRCSTFGFRDTRRQRKFT